MFVNPFEIQIPTSGQPVAKITENKLADFEDNPELLKNVVSSDTKLGKAVRVESCQG